MDADSWDDMDLPPALLRIYRDAPVTADDLNKLLNTGFMDGPFELLDGIVFFGGEPLMFSPYQAQRAAELGVSLPSWIDAIVRDPDLRTEVQARLAKEA